MFSVDELGLIAYLNDNALAETNRSMLGLESDTVAAVLDRYLSRGNGAGLGDGDRLLELLNDRKIGREALSRTAERVHEHLRGGIRTITYWDAGYPGNLKMIADPPLILYIKGKTFPGKDQVAIMGTSNPSRAGLDLALEYGARIARKGRTVVSGLTRGVDAQALEGAMSAGGAPIAILGTPLSDIYPEENKVLAREIGNSGAVVSEITEEAYLHPGRFLQRTRMVGGMSGSLVMIESTGAGGMHHLVELMLRLGRKVYVVDQGEFEDPDHEEGFRKMRGMGAIPVTRPEDVLSSEARQEKLF